MESFLERLAGIKEGQANEFWQRVSGRKAGFQRKRVSNGEREGGEERGEQEREREKVMVQGFVAVHGTPGRQDRCFLSARESLSNESLTGYAFVKAMNWKFSHFAF